MKVLQEKEIIREKKSLFNAKKENEFRRLIYNHKNFLKCDINFYEEEVEFEYNLLGIKSLENLKDESIIDRVKFLINIAELRELTEEYIFELNPENLFYNYNLVPKIKKRDIVSKDELQCNDNFLLMYKSLIGHVLQKKYSYEDYYNGGIDLLKSNKNLNEYYGVNNLEEIKNLLLEKLNNELNDFNKNKIVINKKAFKRKKILNIVTTILLIITAVFTIYSGAFLIPFQNKVITASNSYINQDYEGVINSLSKENIEKLSNNSKYILAYSYIVSENLSDNQKKNILDTINIKSDENILKFWIELERMNYEQAIDIAKKLSDDELLLYALIKQEQDMQNDTSLTGEEKEKKLETIKQEIEKNSKQFDLTEEKDTKKSEEKEGLKLTN